MMPPVVFPIRIGFPQPHLEFADVDFRYLAKSIGEEFPAFRQTFDEIGMPILQSVEDGLKEIGGMGKVLNVLVDHRETVLGEIPQMIHHAGLARAARRGEENMPGAEGFPEFDEESLAKHQIGRVHRSAGVELGAVGVGRHVWVLLTCMAKLLQIKFVIFYI